ncbi:hypothetical protein V6N13_061436 [Hibiscus sabdariffa]
MPIGLGLVDVPLVSAVVLPDREVGEKKDQPNTVSLGGHVMCDTSLRSISNESRLQEIQVEEVEVMDHSVVPGIDMLNWWVSAGKEKMKFHDLMRSNLTTKRSVGIGAKLRAAKLAAKSWVDLENSKDVETVETLENRISCIEQKLAISRMGSGEEAVLKAEAQALNAKLWNRNEVIFNSKLCNETTLYETAVVRLGYECKSKWPSSLYSQNDFLRNPTMVAISWALQK